MPHIGRRKYRIKKLALPAMNLARRSQNSITQNHSIRSIFTHIEHTGLFKVNSWKDLRQE